MKEITSPEGDIEYIITSEEKQIFEFAIKNLALSLVGGVEHD